MALKFASKFDKSLVLVAKVGQIDLVVPLIALLFAICESFCHLLLVILVDEESRNGQGEQHKVEA